jgi:hypothetical protein
MSQNIESQAQQEQVPSSAPVQTQTQAEGSLWEFADIGFDTSKKLWFLQLFDAVNAGVGFYTAKNILMTGGCASQYEWKDMQGRPFWHVRERFLSSEVEGFQIDMKGNLLINFKKNRDGMDAEDRIPKNFSFLQYAYHLTSKANGNSLDTAPMGFVEFCSETGEVIGRLNNKWIVVEDVNRRTAGELPKIRIRVDRKDIGRIIATKSSVIIMSKEGRRSEQLDVP